MAINPYHPYRNVRAKFWTMRLASRRDCLYDASQRIPDDGSPNVSSGWQILDQTLMSDVYTALEEVRMGVKGYKGLGKSPKVLRNWRNIESNDALALFQRNLPRSYYRGVIVGHKEVVDDFRG
jgi:hypothetical protein